MKEKLGERLILYLNIKNYHPFLVYYGSVWIDFLKVIFFLVRIASTNIIKNIVQTLLREGCIENVRKYRENNKYFLILSLSHRRNRKRLYKNILYLKRISRPDLWIYFNYQWILACQEEKVFLLERCCFKYNNNMTNEIL